MWWREDGCYIGCSAVSMRGGERFATKVLLHEVFELGSIPKRIANPQTDAEDAEAKHREKRGRHKCLERAQQELDSVTAATSGGAHPAARSESAASPSSGAQRDRSRSARRRTTPSSGDARPGWQGCRRCLEVAATNAQGGGSTRTPVGLGCRVHSCTKPRPPKSR